MASVKRRKKLYHGTSDRHGILKHGDRITSASSRGAKSHYTTKDFPGHRRFAFATTKQSLAEMFADNASTDSPSYKRTANPVIYEVYWPRTVILDECTWPQGCTFKSENGFRVKKRVFFSGRRS